MVKEITTKSAQDLLEGADSSLASLLDKINYLQTVQSQFITYLDASLRDLCQVAGIKEGRLIVIVSNGSVATLLRFQGPDLVRKFAKNPVLQAIKQIHTKVNRHPPVTLPAQNHPMLALSQQSADLIANMANTLTCPKLRKIMQKIATRVREE